MPWYNPSDPKQRNSLLIGVVCILAIYPFHSFWYTKRTEELAGMQERIESLDTQNRRAEVTLARGGGELEELMALYERHVSKLEELIPAAEEVAALIDDIAERARRTDVELSSLVPEPSEPGGFYTKTSYEMVIVGEYHSVGRFLTEIASLSRIVTPVEVDINLFGSPQTFPEYESPIVANFRIETYVLPDQNAAAAPAGEGAG